MTKLIITIHTTDDPMWALAKLLGEKTDKLGELSEKLFDGRGLYFTENNNPICTIQLVAGKPRFFRGQVVVRDPEHTVWEIVRYQHPDSFVCKNLHGDKQVEALSVGELRAI
jgi:hypothetical protein